MKLNQKHFTIVLISTLVVFLFIGFTGNSNSYFESNLAPEITGVCLELLIIMWIFNKWQEKNKKEQLISVERRLREYLIFFLKHNFKTLPKDYTIGNFFGKNHKENINQIEKIIKYINNNGLKEKEIISIQEHCSREFETLNSLLPVAAGLTGDHFKSWCRIVHFVGCIEKTKEPISSMTINILQNIKKFDQASYQENLYVGAI